MIEWYTLGDIHMISIEIHTMNLIFYHIPHDDCMQSMIINRMHVI